MSQIGTNLGAHSRLFLKISFQYILDRSIWVIQGFLKNYVKKSKFVQLGANLTHILSKYGTSALKKGEKVEEKQWEDRSVDDDHQGFQGCPQSESDWLQMGQI